MPSDVELRASRSQMDGRAQCAEWVVCICREGTTEYKTTHESCVVLLRYRSQLVYCRIWAILTRHAIKPSQRSRNIGSPVRVRAHGYRDLFRNGQERLLLLRE